MITSEFLFISYLDLKYSTLNMLIAIFDIGIVCVRAHAPGEGGYMCFASVRQSILQYSLVVWIATLIGSNINFSIV